jgi:outer membrane receptor protein involved in Fe transport
VGPSYRRISEIKQIEVVRGPASAVWGANAMTGVVNVITRSPRELAREGGGNAVTIGFGGFNRDVTGRDQSAGTLFYVNGSHADAVDDKWSYKVSAGFFTQDALHVRRHAAERHAVSTVCQQRHVAAEI